jgi:hypothetical protein
MNIQSSLLSPKSLATKVYQKLDLQSKKANFTELLHMAELHHNQSSWKSMTDEEYEEQLVNLYKTKVEKAKKIERQNWFNKLSKKEQYNSFLSKLPKILTQIEVQNDAEQITPIFRAS